MTQDRDTDPHRQIRDKERVSFLPFRLQPSTRSFFRQALARREGSRAHTFLEALHGYLYLRWPRLYISLGTGRHPLARWLQPFLYRLGALLGFWGEAPEKSFAASYHGKVVPLPAARRLIRVDAPVDTVVPETVLPYALARRLLLERPHDIALFECPCRATAQTPCLPLDVCLIAGQPFVDFVLEHHPGKARRIPVDQALNVVREAQLRGNVSHAFFKEAMLGRYYAICNCCPCCCGAMQAHASGVPMLVSSGYVAACDDRHCSGCGLCEKKCPFGAIELDARTGNVHAEQPGKQVSLRELPHEEASAPSRKSRAVPHIHRERCYGCGVCALHCPREALTLVRDATKSAPLEWTDAAGETTLEKRDIMPQPGRAQRSA